MNTLKSLQHRIRGWLPKEPNMISSPSGASKMSADTKMRIPKGTLVLFSLFIFLSIVYLLEGNSLGAPFLWLSSILGISFVLDILVALDKGLNEKLVMAILLSAISVGGVLVNIYVFSAPSSTLTRAFSLAMLVLVHVPLLFAVVAYALGKKELTKKSIGWFSGRR